MNTTVVVIVIAVAVAAAVAIVFYMNQRSRRLQSRFGTEYTRAVENSGSKYRAEAKLEKLEKRVDHFSLQPLSLEAADRFQDSWRVIQAGFVDDPRTALKDADRLLSEVMSARGYPVADFEERAAELSVNHALVVEHYRAGHDIAVRNSQGRATTEDLRQAMIDYRALFDDLVGAPEAARVRSARSSS
jgi:type II secretory pathway pseudopilin PulG